MSLSATHLLIVPVALPLVTGALLLLLERTPPRWQVGLCAASTLALAATAVLLAGIAADGSILVYLLGNWKAPFGIVLVLDRLSAAMLVLVAALAIGSGLASLSGFHGRGPHFPAFFQFQLAGLDGAFLTGDLFNLFVFFEVLLIASYALLLHGARGRTLREGFRYVVINLVGSTLFLVAASLVYGAAGTLNLADLALRLPELSGGARAYARAALTLLLAVFALKAAVLPFGFWLPATYASAWAPVAALFAIMTKVGVYAILRVCTTVGGIGDDDGFAPAVAQVALALGVATVVYGAFVALGSSTLRGVVAGLVSASSGSLVAVAASAPGQLGGAIYYLAHSTLAACVMFLLAGAIARQRGPHEDRLESGPALADPRLLGLGYFVAAVAMAGLPPLAGFVGKVLMLEAVRPTPYAAAIFATLLGGGLAAVITLSRAGVRILWKADPDRTGTGADSPLGERAAIVWMLLLLLLLAIGAGQAARFAAASAVQLSTPSGYIGAVLEAAPVRRVEAP